MSKIEKDTHYTYVSVQSKYACASLYGFGIAATSTTTITAATSVQFGGAEKQLSVVTSTLFTLRWTTPTRLCSGDGGPMV